MWNECCELPVGTLTLSMFSFSSLIMRSAVGAPPCDDVYIDGALISMKVPWKPSRDSTGH